MHCSAYTSRCAIGANTVTGIASARHLTRPISPTAERLPNFMDKRLFIRNQVCADGCEEYWRKRHTCSRSLCCRLTVSSDKRWVIRLNQFSLPCPCVWPPAQIPPRWTPCGTNFPCGNPGYSAIRFLVVPYEAVRQAEGKICVRRYGAQGCRSSNTHFGQD